MDSVMIIWPMVLLALFTLAIYIVLSRARVGTVKTGKAKVGDYKLMQNEPEESLKVSNAIRNQYESPVLFYAACLSAYVTGNAGAAMIVLAWLFAISKIAHTWVQVTTNKVRHRRPLFMIAYFVLILMWVFLGFSLIAAG